MKKNILLLTLAILITESAFCILDTIQAKSKITDVTVFFSGAQISRKADLKIAKGKFLVIVDRLPQEINPQSIQVAGIEHCKILSVKHQLNYQNEGKKGNDEKIIDGKVEALEMRMKEIKNRIEVFELEEKLLLDNSILSKKDDGTSIEKIKAASEFYRLKLNEIKQGILNLYTESETINKSIQAFYAQINELTSKNRKTYSQIMIALESDKEISDKINISYYISSAGWEPLYDFRVDDITKPLVIVYNANVYQSSGEDWNNVNIKLSSNNPSLSGYKPELPVWFLGGDNFYKNVSIKEGIGSLKGIVTDNKTGESLPFISVIVKKGDQQIAGGSSDFDGQYAIKPIQSGSYSVKFSSVGYKPKLITGVIIKSSSTSFLNARLEPNAMDLDEVEIVSYKLPLIEKDAGANQTAITREDIKNMSSRSPNGIIGTVGGVGVNDNIALRGARAESTYTYVDGVKVRGGEVTNLIANSLKETVTNLEYVIEIPYTIPSDGEDYSLKIKEASIEVNYIYHAVPKIDNDAFLTAEINDWNQLNLLSGKSSIYYQGTFTGESFIDVKESSDTLIISLGRDKNILIKRDGKKETNDKRVVGNSIKESIGWDITVKNNKNAKIKIVVEDQFPISELKSVEVERLENSGANLEDKTGKLTWELNLEPNEKKILNYIYTVKYPKGTNFSME